MKVAVVGASGYTGLELLRILQRHSSFELVAATSEQRAGEVLGDAFPALRGQLELELEALDPRRIAERAELAFAALPHAASAPTVQALRKAGVAVVDLSADWRLGSDAERPDGVLCGLPELERETPARLVSHPGCFTTAVTLACAPLQALGLARPRYRVTAVTR